MSKKKVIVSRSGLTTCPSCMSHITLHADLAQTECPFCQANLVAERRQDGDVFGHNTLQTLKKSKSAMLAAALGVSLSMAACGEKEDNIGQPIYGAPLVDQGYDMNDGDMNVEDMKGEDMDKKDMGEDMIQPQPLYGGVPTDMADDMDVDMKDMEVAVPEYGAPATDM